MSQGAVGACTGGCGPAPRAHPRAPLFPLSRDYYFWAALTLCQEREKPPAGISPLSPFPSSLTGCFEVGHSCVLISPTEWLSCGFICSFSCSVWILAATRGDAGPGGFRSFGCPEVCVMVSDVKVFLTR